MKNKIRNLVLITSFVVIISGFMLANIILPDRELSYTERRRLLAPPVYSLETLLSGELFEKYEEYFLDQFVFRDWFRGLKAFTSYYLLNQKDNNGLYIIDGNIIKIEYPLNERAILNASKKFNEVYEKYLQGLNVSYAVIPDKNYFTGPQNGYLTIDYQTMLELLHASVVHMAYIDLFNYLAIDDYYNTDIHWSQDRLIQLADKILQEMGSNIKASDFDYEKRELYPFYGSYYGQVGLKVSPDTLVYLTNSLLENAVVFDHQYMRYSKVYEIDRFSGMDPYDIFLSGAKPLISIENPDNPDGKELVIFRDSYASSIAPLLLAGYSKVTLVDLRYMTTDLVGQFIEFSPGTDVLFLYGTQVLNNSFMLR